MPLGARGAVSEEVGRAGPASVCTHQVPVVGGWSRPVRSWFVTATFVVPSACGAAAAASLHLERSPLRRKARSEGQQADGGGRDAHVLLDADMLLGLLDLDHRNGGLRRKALFSRRR